RTLKQGEQFDVVESVKTVSDLYSPVTGKVVEINSELDANPELVNSGPYEAGWMLKIEIANPDELNQLLDADAYKAFTEEAGH
ncbi:MAG: glycine cleavage system protein, partial [Firmicutes bacterium]|nr:glycine cleavage system protein [Bacillota bacterium]